nr:hypothetical protein CFP56_71569 [Quercus suber]
MRMEGFDGVWEKLESPLAINGFIALYANFDEEYLCLIPKSPVYLEGAGGELGNKLGQDLILTLRLSSAVAIMHTYERCARVLIMFNQPWYMNAFVHHPLVILLTALEVSYMMTCEINNISWHHPMVSELLANWIIFAKKPE